MEYNIETTSRKYTYAGLFLMFAVFGSVFLWAVFGRVDKVVLMQGKVVVGNIKKPVELKDWGTVSNIYVKEGDFVKKGDVLFEVSRTEDITSRELSEAEYLFFMAKRDRLESEVKLLREPVFSADLISYPDPEVRQIIQTQREVFFERKQKLESQLSLIDEKISQSNRRIQDLTEILRLKNRQLEENREMLRQEEMLLAEGLSTKDRVFNLQERVREIGNQIRDLEGQVFQEKLKVEEYIRQKEYAVKEFVTAASGELADVRKLLKDAAEKKEMYDRKVQEASVKAEIDGQVVGLQVYHKGQVVKPGQVVMYIVPQGSQIFVEGVISSADRDNVKVGMKVRLNFISFANITARDVEGQVVYISDDTVYDEGLKQEVYRVRVNLTEEGFKALRQNRFEIVSGMPVVGYITTGSVRPVYYVLEPLIMLLKSGFRSN